MPRNDRWRPRQVHRMITPESRAEAARREAERQEQQRRDAERAAAATVPGRARERRRTSMFMGAAVDCVHGVPWTKCTTCSKPKSQP